MTNNLNVELIFSLLERKYDVPLIEAEYKFDAVAAENEVARALKVKPRNPIFRLRSSLSTCALSLRWGPQLFQSFLRVLDSHYRISSLVTTASPLFQITSRDIGNSSSNNPHSG